MEGIYFKEGIYVLIDNDIKNEHCIYHYNNKDRVILYGGRVNLTYIIREKEYAQLLIDGIPIMNEKISNRLSLPVITSYLNAIETHGIDAFLKNYKINVDFLYGELKEMNQKMELLLTYEQDASKVNNILSEIDKLRKLLLSVLTLLFSLNSFMSAGLENDKVTSVCQSIMDTMS